MRSGGCQCGERGRGADLNSGRLSPTFGSTQHRLNPTTTIMSASPKLDSVRTRLENVIALARLLERVERSSVAPDPGQYRALVSQLGEALESNLPEAALKAVLNAYPATAELYENLHYEKSGLLRSPLERSVETEMLTSQTLHRIAKAAKGQA